MGLTNVPNGWKSITLDQIVDFANGKPLEGSVTADGSVNLITLDSVDIQGNLKSDHKKIKNSDGSLRAGDIVSVLSDLAHGNLLGLSAVIPHGAEFSLNQRMGRLRTKGDNSPEFIRRAVNFNQKHFKERGQGTSQRHIYRRDFDQLEILLPPEDEQKAIAEALSDIDELRNHLILERSKLENIKLAEIYSLINPVSLANNGIPMVNHKVADFALSLKGYGQNKASLVDTASHPCILYGELFTTYSVVIEQIVSFSTKAEGTLSVSGDVLIPGSTTTVGRDLATASVVRQKGVYLGGDINIIRIIDASKLLPEYFAYLFRYILVDDVEKMAQGTTIKHLYGKDIMNLDIPLPSKDYQLRAFEILNDLEKRIQMISSEIFKYECLTKAMMNDLLTGKVRLV